MAGRRRAPAEDRSIRGSFDWLLVLWFGLGMVVLIEPAPFDLLAVILFPLGLLTRRLEIPKASGFALACVAVFVATNVISLLFCVAVTRGVGYVGVTVYVLALWLFTLGLVGKHGERMVRVIMIGWAGGAVITTVLSVASYFGYLPIYELIRTLPIYDILSMSGRVHGFFKDANVYGAALIPPALWAAAHLVGLERGHRPLWAMTLIVCAVGVLLSYSRGAWISFGLSLVSFFGLRMIGVRSHRARVMMLFVLPVAAALLTVALVRLTAVDAVEQMLEIRVGMQSYDENRFAIQRDAVEVAMRSPLGIGPGQTELVVTRATHQAYLRTFVENGYLGGLAFTALVLASLARSTWLALAAHDTRMQVVMAMVAASLFGHAVESFVIDTVHWRHFWVLLAIAWAPVGGWPGAQSPGPAGGRASSTRSAA